MKKRIIILGIFFLIFILYMPKASATTKNSIVGIVNTNGANLNVRRTSSTSSQILDKLPDKSYITILEQSGSWYFVEYRSNQYGYVYKDYVKGISSIVKQVSTGGANLNVRMGPATSYPILHKFKDLEYVLILKEEQGWSKVIYDGNKIGYVSSTYLISNSYLYPNINLNVPSYKQYDSRWADEPIGSSKKTFRQIGCLTTSMAMVESYRRGETISPSYMASISSYTASGELYWPSRYKFKTSSSTYLNDAYSLLKQGKPVLIGGKTTNGSQHWVVIYGYEGGNTLTAKNFMIHDPGSATRTRLDQYLNSYPIFYKLAYYSY